MEPTEAAADRFSRLLDLVRDSAGSRPPGLAPHEQEEFDYVRSVLDAIDGSWLAETEALDRVRALFLRRLAAEQPDHPWVTSSMIRTLGDLVRLASLEDEPALPPQSLARLAADSTPLEPLLERTRRPALVGQALRRADVPPDAIGTFFLWLNRALGQLVPQPATARGLLYARRQRPPRTDGPPGGLLRSDARDVRDADAPARPETASSKTRADQGNGNGDGPGAER